jgi:hypothetical protein
MLTAPQIAMPSPAPLTWLLAGQDVVHTSTIGWAELSNGVLLATAGKEGFEILLTIDQNIRYQPTGLSEALYRVDRA